MGKVDADPGEVLIEPDLRVAEHEVVLRDLGVGVPGLGEGGGAARKLGPVAGRIGAGKQIENDVAASAVGQGADDEVKTDVPGGDVVVMGADVGDEMIENRLGIVRELAEERDGLGGLAAGVVAFSGFVVELAIERRANGLHLSRPLEVPKRDRQLIDRGVNGHVE